VHISDPIFTHAACYDQFNFVHLITSGTFGEGNNFYEVSHNIDYSPRLLLPS
jgi:hypothetical protein